MRVFLDTNVLVSAFATRGLAAAVLVTGDHDLLDVAAKAPLKIVDPRGFWELASRASPG